MPKTNRSGQALTLSSEQLDSIMAELSPKARAVFSLCRFTAARITEALSLKWENVTSTDIVIPKAITKKKMRTRTIPMNPKLWEEIAHWKPNGHASSNESRRSTTSYTQEPKPSTST